MEIHSSLPPPPPFLGQLPGSLVSVAVMGVKLPTEEASLPLLSLHTKAPHAFTLPHCQDILKMQTEHPHLMKQGGLCLPKFLLLCPGRQKGSKLALPTPQHCLPLPMVSVILSFTQSKLLSPVSRLTVNKILKYRVYRFHSTPKAIILRSYLLV
jgi:hypothetical protein